MSAEVAARPPGMGLRKYWSAAIFSAQDAFTYRATAVVWMLVDFVPSVVMILVWQAAYRTQTSVEGYSLHDMVTYYLATGIIAGALTSHAEFTMNWEIRDGRLTPQLTRPISYPVLVMCKETGWLIAKFIVGIPVFALLVFIFRHHVLIPHLSPAAWVGFGLSCLFAYLILSLIGVCLGCLSLWTIESSGVFELWWSLGGVLSGSLLPLELLPGILRHVAFIAPHRWGSYFPVRVLLGKVPVAGIYEGVLIQFCWVIALAIIVTILWRVGTRKYEGWGG
jgi:ABC-2 type transport system permease protein